MAGLHDVVRAAVLLTSSLSVSNSLNLLVHHQALDFDVLVVRLEKLVLEVADAERLIQLVLLVSPVRALAWWIRRDVATLAVFVAVLGRLGLFDYVKLLDAKVVDLILACSVPAHVLD